VTGSRSPRQAKIASAAETWNHEIYRGGVGVMQHHPQGLPNERVGHRFAIQNESLGESLQESR
jgi:hypothetical protein